MSIPTTDAEYNKASRYLQQKVIIYFPGITPVVVTRDDYLISTGTLEEAHATSGSIPFGKVSSNELNIKLSSPNGLFAPSNKLSPYYSKMIRGVKIELYTRPVPDPIEYDWDPMGVYYVTTWSAQVTGITADITANDKLYDVFKLSQIVYPIKREISYHDFYSEVFAALGITAEIDVLLTNKLRYAYIMQANKDFLSELGVGALSDCYCKHNGNIVVNYLYKQRVLRATITDGDQIIDATINQTIDMSYDGSEVTCNLPQESAEQNVLSVKNFSVSASATETTTMLLSSTPLIRMSKVATTGAPQVHVINVNATPSEVTFEVQNPNASPYGINIDFFGTIINTYKVTYKDEGVKLLSIDNKYMQSFLYASMVKDYLHKYVSSELPILSLNVRGNPKWELGDKLRIVSERYHLDFTGILISNKSTYDGSFSSALKLIDATLLEGVI